MADQAKVLVVEDERSVLEAYIKALEKRYNLAVAQNGQEGLDKMKSFHPDLILLDIIMPIKHGHDFLMEKKNMDEFKDTPVFVMTNVKSDAEMEKARIEGANEYYVKSEIKLEELIVAIEKHIGPAAAA